MIVNNLTTFVSCKGVSATEFLTSTFIHLNDGSTYPVGFSIPIAGGNTGLTLVYYTRLLSHDYDKNKIYIDGSNGVLGYLDSNINYGIFSGNMGFRVNGKFFGNADMTFQYGARYMYDPAFSIPGSTWSQIMLRTTNNTSQRADGSIFVNLYAGSTSTTDGLPAVDYSHLAVYYRELTDAEINMVTPPTDYAQLYTFANYQSGDTVIPEIVSGVLNGTYIYN